MKIAVYGASGYVGKFIVGELRRRDVDVVLVGRDAGRLHQAARDAGVSDAEVRVADTSDHAALVAAFTGTDAVIAALPSFTGSGEPVVRAAIAAGSHYVDVAGEQLFVRRIFDGYAAEAERAGVTVVPAVTDSSLLGDLLAHLAAERLGTVDEIVVSHVAHSGGSSRGSMRTLLANLEVFTSGGLGYADGAFVAGGPPRRAQMQLPGRTGLTEMVKFPQPPVITIPRHVRVRTVEGALAADILAMVGSVTPAILDTATEAPSAPPVYTLLVDAYGEDGRHVRAVADGRNSYLNCAQFAVEAAYRLVRDGAKPGVLAPAEAFDPTDFLDSLAGFGITWSLTG